VTRCLLLLLCLEATFVGVSQATRNYDVHPQRTHDEEVFLDHNLREAPSGKVDLTQRFHQLDVDHSGSLAKNEVAKEFSSRWIRVTRKDIEDEWDKYDVNKSGRLGLNEFVKMGLDLDEGVVHGSSRKMEQHHPFLPDYAGYKSWASLFAILLFGIYVGTRLAKARDTSLEAPGVLGQIRPGEGPWLLFAVILLAFLVYTTLRMTYGRMEYKTQASYVDKMDFSIATAALFLLLTALMCTGDTGLVLGAGAGIFLGASSILIVFRSMLHHTRVLVTEDDEKHTGNDTRWLIMSFGVSLHLMIILVFALIYWHRGVSDFSHCKTAADAVYFSAIVHTGTGYGDILPVTWQGKTIVILHTMYGFAMSCALGNAMLIRNYDTKYSVEHPNETIRLKDRNLKTMVVSFLSGMVVMGFSCLVIEGSKKSVVGLKFLVWAFAVLVFIISAHFMRVMIDRRMNARIKIKGDLFSAAMYQFTMTFVAMSTVVAEWDIRYEYYNCHAEPQNCPNKYEHSLSVFTWRQFPAVSFLIILIVYAVLIYKTTSRHPHRDFAAVVLLPLIHSICIFIVTIQMYANKDQYDGVVTFLDAFYMTSCTHTSLGFGDFALNGEHARYTAIVHSLSAYFTGILGSYVMLDDDREDMWLAHKREVHMDSLHMASDDDGNERPGKLCSMFDMRPSCF